MTESRWVRWRHRLTTTALVTAPMVWVWASARGSTAPVFPPSLLQAEGLVLTALVFMLGFSQSHLRRAADDVLADARRWENQLAEAHRDDPGRMPTTTVKEWATKDLDAVTVARSEVMASPRDWAMRAGRYAPFAEHGWLGNSFDKAVDVYRIRSELDRSADAPDTPSPRRRKWLAKEAEVIQAQRRALLSDATDLGVLRSGGLRPLVGRYRVAQTTTGTVLRLVNAYVTVMVVVVVLGVLYAGWDAVSAPPPEIWAAMAFPALAYTYARVVRADVRREGAQLLGTLEGLWHLRLNTAEHQLEDEHREVQIMVRASVEWVNVYAPGLPWTSSLRGRMLLALAAQRAWDTDDGAVELLDAAAQELRHAVKGNDDPLAALALARTLEVLNEIRPSQSSRVDRQIDGLIDTACKSLRDDSPLRDSDFRLEAVQCRQVQTSRVLWPADPDRAALLEQIVGPARSD